jgi:uncharacterized protein
VISVKRVWIRRAVYAIAALCLLDALIEPYLLRVDHEEIAGSRMYERLRIAHVSDLHVQSFGLREKALLRALAEEKPDLIAITGDTVDHGNLELARPLIAAMRAPLGVFAVPGNWEHWRPVQGDQAAFYASAGARLLRNERVRVRHDVLLFGFDDALSGSPDVSILRTKETGMRIALFHAPIGIDLVKDDVDLALAGHTHGGQMRVPFFGPLFRPPGSGEYDRGWYSRGNAWMHVSSGVGTSILRLRFACRPQLAIIDVNSYAR